MEGDQVVLRSLISEWKKATDRLLDAAEELGEYICQLLKPVIPDIEWYIGDYEAGIEVLRFESEIFRRDQLDLEDDFEFLDTILNRELCWWGAVDDPRFVAYIKLLPDEASEVRRIIRRALGRGDNGDVDGTQKQGQAEQDQAHQQD